MQYEYYTPRWNFFWAYGYSQKHRLVKHDWILTIHFSIKIPSLCGVWNDILIEDDILKVISFNGGVSGATTFIVDAEALFGKRYLDKINLKIKTGA